MTDLQLAREKQAEFDRWKRDHNKQLPVELSVTVLTTGFWPTYKVCTVCHEACTPAVRLALFCHCKVRRGSRGCMLASTLRRAPAGLPEGWRGNRHRQACLLVSSGHLLSSCVDQRNNV